MVLPLFGALWKYDISDIKSSIFNRFLKKNHKQEIIFCRRNYLYISILPPPIKVIEKFLAILRKKFYFCVNKVPSGDGFDEIITSFLRGKNLRFEPAGK